MAHDEKNNSSNTGTKVPMTHVESMLSLIDYLQVEGCWDIDEDSKRFEMVAKNYRALRAVVERTGIKMSNLFGEDNPYVRGYNQALLNVQEIVWEKINDL